MTLRDHLAGTLARDSRYSIQAYAFVFEALEFTKSLRKKARARSRARDQAKGRPAASRKARHVTGQELCEGARGLALESYGMLAITVLNLWGIHSTSDIGEVVYNLIASGDLLKTPTDSRADFDDVYDFEQAFRGDFAVALDDIA